MCYEVRQGVMVIQCKKKNKNKKSTCQSQHQYRFAQVTTISVRMTPRLDERSHAETIFRRYHSAAAGGLNPPKHESCADVDDGASRTTRSISTWHIVFFKRTRFPKWKRSQQSRQDILDNWVDISCCPGFCTDTWSITCELPSRLSILETVIWQQIA